MRCLQLAVVAVLFTSIQTGAQEVPKQETPKKDATWLLPVPELDVDKSIPTLEHVVGHRWGREISSHAEIERYLHALAQAAPERCQLTKYGQSYQGKTLYNLVITAPSNLRRLEEIRKNNLALADSRVTSADQAAAIAESAPIVVWLAYCVHGNEASPSDAALLTAYHLLADRRPETKALLEKVVVILDPLQNPDGRDRFVHFHRESRGGFDQDHPLSADRLERWPGGRFNHYLFDMNRDWYQMSQKETLARVTAYLRWKPQIFVDAHEMGANTTYFFDPSTEPYNPHTLRRQKDWHLKIGRTHAEHFDRHGFAYTTREMFDAFGPQYGSTWPILHGSIGILWEQAGVRGRVIARQDQTKLYYHDGVRHHYVSGLATLEAAGKNRRDMLVDFRNNAADSVKLGEKGPVRAFYLLEGKRPARAAALAQLLVRNGIEVQRVTSAIKQPAADTITEKTREHEIPAGSYCVDMAQPASRLALTLLERHQDMGAAYLKRQEDRVRRGLPDEIYDATSWSLPLAYDVSCLSVTGSVPAGMQPYLGNPTVGKVVGNGKRPRIGYLVSGDDDNVLPMLCRWLTGGLRVHVFSEPTKVNGVNFPRGSLFLRLAENPETVHEAVAAAAQAQGVVIHAVDNAFVEDGASLGGPNVHWVKPPRVLLVTDRPAEHSVGHTWYLFDQVWHYPITRIAAQHLPEVDFGKFDVCILPHGSYEGADAPTEDTLRRLKDWVQTGGSLILVGGATAWAAGEKVKLLKTDLEVRKTEKKEEPKEPREPKDKPEKRPPLQVPGVFLRAVVDTDHFATWGFDPETVLFFSGNVICSPLRDGAGKNLITFAEGKDMLVSGYCWSQTTPLLPGRPYLLYQTLGRGHITAFADDPNFRASSPHLQRLFFNATFFSPAIRVIPPPRK